MYFIRRYIPQRTKVDLRNLRLAAEKEGVGVSLAYIKQRFFRAPRILRRQVPLAPVPKNEFDLHILCGAADFTMALWALHAWFQATRTYPKVIWHDDGTLTRNQCLVARRLIPEVELIGVAQARTKLAKVLDRYPVCSRLRLSGHHLFLTKLFDVLAFAQGMLGTVLLDSDVVLFRFPTEIIDHIRSGSGRILAFHECDFIETPYKVSDEWLAEHGITPEARRLNAGIVCFNKDRINLDVLEEYYASAAYDVTGELEPQDLFIDQSGWSIIASSVGFQLLDKRTYHIKGSVHKDTIAKHYTAPRRHQFYTEALPHLEQSLAIDSGRAK
jgi:hypothetical protein